ncbi:MAG: restriction endonuclease [Kiritimatiellae bacterium]|nr:restriction endonuclease [Kiritimatiellia bacterium]
MSIFHPGELYTHEEIYRILSVGNAGGIRVKINHDGTIQRAVVLTAVPTARVASENPYHDRVEGDVLVYTGAGQEGDQALGGWNKRLLEQVQHPFPVYAFLLVESRRSKKYGTRRWRFLGLLNFLRHYKETQIDVRGGSRSVWVFEFRVLSRFDGVSPDYDAKLMVDLIAEQDKSDPLVDADSIVEAAPSVSASAGADPLELEGLRRRMLALPPDRFEHLVRDVLVWSGFRDVRVTKYSQDGGVDVNAIAGQMMWPLRDLLLQVQAKRWLHTVGRKEVAELRGSLQPDARGAVVTTSHFSKAALLEASEAGKRPIVLVDGFEFSRIVLTSGVFAP